MAAFKPGDRVRVTSGFSAGKTATVQSGPDCFGNHVIRFDRDGAIQGMNSRFLELFESSKLGHYAQIGQSIGAHVDKAQAAYGDSFGQAADVLRVYLRPYRNQDGTYTIPDSLLDHLLAQVRIIDKQFRIFSNPSGDLMNESPYKDIVGYGLLGAAKAGEVT